MILRKARPDDMNTLYYILEDARRRLGLLGIDQWQKGSPSIADIRRDTENGSYYVAEAHGRPAGGMALIFTGEPTYNKIDGGWRLDAPYGVIHRVAVAPEFLNRGVGGFLLSGGEDICRERGVMQLRIDTHRGNAPMQALIKSRGFDYRGIILLENGDERLAYDKLL